MSDIRGVGKMQNMEGDESEDLLSRIKSAGNKLKNRFCYQPASREP